jgi:uncharacterized protein (TIGR00369 family)
LKEILLDLPLFKYRLNRKSLFKSHSQRPWFTLLIIFHRYQQGAGMEISQQILDDFNQNSLYQTIGIRIAEASDGEARSVLKPEASVCWPSAEQPHGGILFTLIDTTMAWAIMSKIGPEYSCTTIDLNMHYTAPAKGDLFSCLTIVTHQTRRTCFLRGEIYDSKDRLVAMGQGAFRIVQAAFITIPDKSYPSK